MQRSLIRVHDASFFFNFVMSNVFSSVNIYSEWALWEKERKMNLTILSRNLFTLCACGVCERRWHLYKRDKFDNSIYFLFYDVVPSPDKQLVFPLDYELIPS